MFFIDVRFRRHAKVVCVGYICKKAVNTYPSVKQFVSYRQEFQKMCDKASDIWHFVFPSAPYKTQKMCA